MLYSNMVQHLLLHFNGSVQSRTKWEILHRQRNPFTKGKMLTIYYLQIVIVLKILILFFDESHRSLAYLFIY